jgi:hypothetical protein
MESTNKYAFDRFSVVHAGFGAWAASRGFGLIPTLLMHTAWEVVEAHYHEKRSPDRFVFRPEPIYNRIGDTIAALVGWAMFSHDRLRDDPWVGETNPMYLLLSPKTEAPPE